MTTSADVVNLGDSRRVNELTNRFNQIKAMDVIADLFALVTKDSV